MPRGANIEGTRAKKSYQVPEAYTQDDYFNHETTVTKSKYCPHHSQMYAVVKVRGPGGSRLSLPAPV